MVSTLDSESSDLSSNLGRTLNYYFYFMNGLGIKTSRYDDNSITVIKLSRALLSTCLTLGTSILDWFPRPQLTNY